MLKRMIPTEKNICNTYIGPKKKSCIQNMKKTHNNK